MSQYDNQLLNSDLDVFKQQQILTASVTFSGTLAAGAESILLTNPIPIDSIDYSQILFDNSFYHPGRYRMMMQENATLVNETTSPSQLQCNVYQIVDGGNIRLGARIQNPYGVAVNLSTTTINFRYVPYQATV